MLVLLAAATVAAAPADILRTPNFYRVPAECADARFQVLDRFGKPAARRLGDLPAATAILLVDRKVDGCRVITVKQGALPPLEAPSGLTSPRD
jgi:hypothetical protein